MKPPMEAPTAYPISTRMARTLLLILVIQFQVGPALVWANPGGEQLVAGVASFDRTGSTLTVTQGTDRAVIHWQDFSIAHGELTTFIQPSSTSAVLNRVVSDQLSSIYGTLQANGQVYLINPNGIVVGSTGVINTAGFMASTLDVANEEFLGAGDMTFQGGSTASVVNLGKIGADGGDVVLIARTVENRGEIRAGQGTAALAAGAEVLVKASGQERIFVQPRMDTNGHEGGRIENRGLIEAAAAELKAAGGNEYALAIQNTGVVRATAVQNRGGKIWLSASKGTVSNSGTLEAKGASLAQVTVRGDRVAMKDSAAAPAVVRSEGAVEIEGREAVELDLLAHPDSWIVAAGNLVLRSDAVVLGDAHFQSGNFRVEKMDGTPGDLVSPNDPVILSAGDVTIGNYTGASLHIMAGGSITTGNLTITGADTVGNSIGPGNTATYNGTNTLAELATVTLSDGTTVVNVDGSAQATLDLRAGIDWSLLGGLSSDFTAGTAPTYTPVAATGSAISTGAITISNSLSGGMVLLTNQYQANTALAVESISTAAITAFSTAVAGNGAAVVMDSRAGLATTGAIINGSSGGGSGGDIHLRSVDGMQLGGSLSAIASGVAGAGDGGDITLVAGDSILFTNAGSNTISTSTSATNTSTVAGSAGAIRLTAGQNITAGALLSEVNAGGTNVTGGAGGAVTVNAGGDISLTRVSTQGTLASGAISVGSAGDVAITSTSGDILINQAVATSVFQNSSTNDSVLGDAGDITLSASAGSITVDGLLARIVAQGSGDRITGRGGDILAEGQSVAITGSNAVNFVASNVQATSATTSTVGRGGNITLRGSTGDVTVNNSNTTSGLRSGSEVNGGAAGAGGDILIEATNGALNFTGSAVSMSSSSSGTLGAGDAGAITLRAREINRTAPTFNINARSTSFGSGNAGNGGAVELIASAGGLDLQGGINTASQALGSSGRAGSAGSITVDVAGAFVAAQLQADAGLINFSNTLGDVGGGGAIRVEAGSITLASVVSEVNLLSSVGTGGNAGSITLVSNSGNIAVTGIVNSRASRATNTTGGTLGDGGSITITSDGAFNASALESSSRMAGTGAVGRGGDIVVTADSINLTGQSGVALSSQSSADSLSTAGRGGDISLTATEGDLRVRLASGGSITSTSTGAVAGQSGDILLSAVNGRVTLDNVSTVTSTSSGGAGSGDAGAITLVAEEFERLNAGTVSWTASSLTNTGDTGDAGLVSLTLTNGGLDLGAGSLISSLTRVTGSSGNAGSAGGITVDVAGALVAGNLLADTGLTSFSNASGNLGSGGVIDVRADSMTLGSVSSEVSLFNSTGTGGSGGAVTLEATSGAIAVGNAINSRVIRSASATSGTLGDGGSITITVPGAFNAAVLNSSAALLGTGTVGRGGDITVTAASIDLTGQSTATLSSLSSVSGGGAVGRGGDILMTATSGDLRVRHATGGSISSASLGDAAAQGGDILLSAVNGRVTLDNVTGVTSSSSGSTGSGDAGAITVEAEEFERVNIGSTNWSASSQTNTGNAGDGGAVRIVTTVSGLDLGGSITTSSQIQGGSGNAGSGSAVTLSAAGNILGTDLTTQARLNSTVNTTGAVGSGGTVSVTSGGTISLQNIITRADAQNGSGGAGSAGGITLTATNGSITTRELRATATFSAGGLTSVGNGGDITILAQSFSKSGGVLASNTSVSGGGTAGDGGDISITSTGAGGISLSQDLLIGDLTTASFGGSGTSGNGGRFILNAGTAALSFTGSVEPRLRTSAQGQSGAGNGGEVQITAGSLTTTTGLFQGVQSSSSTFLGNAGNGGAVSITLTNGGLNIGTNGLNTSAENAGTSGNAGSGGAVSLSARDGVVLAGDISSRTRLSNAGNTTGAVGSGGAVSVISSDGALNLRSIDSSVNLLQGTGGTGSAGDILLHSGTSSITTHQLLATVRSFTGGTANVGSGGDITIEAATSYTKASGLLASNVSVSGSGSAGDGGDISITANIVSGGTGVSLASNSGLDDFNTSSLSSLGQAGAGGDFRINAGSTFVGFFGSAVPEIRTFSSGQTGAGNGGTVDIVANGFTGSQTLQGIQTFSRTQTGNAGNGGAVSVNLDEAAFSLGFTGIQTFSQVQGGSGSAGSGGAVTVAARDGVSLSGGIGAQTLLSNPFNTTGAVSSGGAVSLTATTGNISLSGGINSSAELFFGTGGAGDAGDISVTATGGAITIPGLLARATSSSTGAVNVGSGGDITVLGQSYTKSSGFLSSSASVLGSGTAGNGGDISITATGAVGISLVIQPGGIDMSSASASTFGAAGDGGDFLLSASTGAITLTGSAFTLNSSSIGLLASGDAGAITLDAGQLNNSVGPISFNSRSTASGPGNTGDGGDILIRLTNDDLNLSGGTLSTLSQQSGAAGNAGRAGDVTLDISGTISGLGTINAFSFLTNNANTTGLIGGSGDVTITGGGDVTLGAINASSLAGHSGATQTQGGGDIRVTSIGGNLIVGQLESRYDTSTLSSVTAGNVLADAGSITLQAAQGTITGTSLFTSTLSSQGTAGDGGDITVTAESISFNGQLLSRSVISGASSVAAGDGGDITLTATAGDVLFALFGGGVFQTLSQSSGGTSSTAGSGGDVIVTASGLVQIASAVQTNALGSGAVGSGGSVSIQGGQITASTITTTAASSTSTAGSGGSITLDATLSSATVGSLDSRATTSGSAAAGSGGAVTVSAATDISITGSVTTLVVGALGAGAGGDVEIDAGNALTLTGSIAANTSSSAGQAGEGGNITLMAGGLLGFAGSMNASSQTFVGNGSNGGDILVDVAGPINFTNAISTWSDAGDGAVLGDAGDVAIISRDSGAVDGADGITLTQAIQADSTVNGGQTGEGGRGGDLTITAEDGSITLLNGINLASTGTTGARGGGRLELDATHGNISLVAFNGRTQSTGGVNGNSGGASLQATGNVTFNSTVFETFNSTSNGQTGDAGDITVQGSSILNNGGFNWTMNAANSASIGTGLGNGGDISLTATAGDVQMAQVTLSAQATGNGARSGSGGAVTVSATGQVQLTDILANTNLNTGNPAGFAGSGGAVSVTAGGDISLRNVNSEVQIFNSASSGGSAGNVSISSTNGSLTINQIFARTFAQGSTPKTLGDGGTVNLSALNGTVTTGLINTQAEVLAGGSVGSGGDITVVGNSVDITGTPFGVTLYSGSLINGAGNSGDGGDITLRALTGNLRLRNNSSGNAPTTSARALGTTGTAGSGGDLLIEANNGAFQYENATGNINLFSVGTGGAGNGGSFTVNALSLDRSLASSFAVNASSSSSSGQPGNGGSVLVDIQTGNLAIDTINTVSSMNGSTGTAGNGGDVTLRARAGALTFGSIDSRSVVTSGGSISPSGGDGGDVLIEASGLISRTSFASISTGSVLAFSNGAAGDGGSITLRSTAGAIDLSGSSFTISSVSQSSGGVAGDGGDITLTAATSITFSSTVNLLSTSDGGTVGGQGGDITFTAPILNHSGGPFTANASGELPIGGSSGNVVMDAVVDSTNNSITLNAGRDGLVDWRDGGAVAGTLNLFGGDVNILSATTAGSLDVRAHGEGGAVGDITVDQALGYAAPGGTGSYFFFAAGDIFFNRSLQLDGTGGLLALAGWDRVSTSITPALSSTQWGNNNGTVLINNASSTQAVEVGSRGGQTTVLGHEIRLTAGAATNTWAQIGWRPADGNTIATTGNIVASAKAGGINAAAGAQQGSHVQIGHGGGRTSFAQSVGDVNAAITLASTGDLTFTGGGGQYAYAQIGHGGREAAGNFSGNITISQAGDLTFTGGTTSAYAQIGHGGIEADGNHSGIIQLSNVGDVVFTGGVLESFAQIGHGGSRTTGSHTGAIRILQAGAIEIRGGQNQESHALLGHGGYTSDGSHTGDILLQDVGDVLVNGGVSFASSLAQIGHGGYQSFGNHSGGITLQRTGTVTLQSLFSLGSEARIGHGGFITDGSHGGAIFLDQVGSITLTGSSLGDAVQIGHGGRGADGDLSGTITITSTGAISLTGGGLNDTAQIGHGANTTTGTRTGDISITAASVSLTGGSNGNAPALIGHNGATTTPSGNIRVETADNITLTAATAAARIGHNSTGAAGNTLEVIAGNDVRLQNAGTVLQASGNVTVVVDNDNPTRPAQGTGALVNNGQITSTGGTVTLFAVNAAQTTLGTINQTAGTFGKRYNKWFGETGSLANGVNYKFQPTLTITADNQTKVYGETFTFAGTEFTFTGLESGDTFADAVSGSAVSLSSGGSASTAGVAGSPYAITASAVATDLGYDLVFVDGEMTVSPAALTITADDQTKVYGQTFTFAGTEFTSTGLQNGETIGSVTLTSSGSAATADVAGSPYAIAASAPVGGTFDTANYDITFVDGEMEVTRAALTITADDQTKVYGQTFTFLGTEFTSTGLQNGETIGSVTLTSSGAAATAGVASSPYAIAASAPVGGTFDTANYDITFVDGEMEVTRAALTITADDQTKVYGQTFTFVGTEFTSTGLQNGESIGSVTLTSSGSAATAGVAGSPYAIAASAPVGGTFDTANYDITFVDGELEVTRAALTITADDQTKVYGQTLTFLGTEFTSTGLQNGESIGSVTLTSSGSAATAGVAGSPYAIAASAPVGGTFDTANYDITFVDGELEVTRAALAITADDQTKVYGQTFTFAGTEFTSTGLQNGESIGSVTFSSAGSAATAGVTGSPYAIAASAPVGGTFDTANYDITFVDGELEVTRAALTITADDQTKVYGQTFTFLGTEFTSTGLQNGEIIGSVTLASVGEAGTAGVAASPYAIEASVPVGGTFDTANYDITFVDGELEVTAAPVTVTANGGTSVYGTAGTNPGLSAAGLQNGEDVSVLTGLANSFNLEQWSNAGTYVLTVDGTLANPNYAVTGTVSGTWIINPVVTTVTVTANDALRGFGLPNPVFTASVQGLLGDPNPVMDGFTFSTPAGPSSIPGDYPITPSGGMLSANYTGSSVIYLDAVLTVEDNGFGFGQVLLGYFTAFNNGGPTGAPQGPEGNGPAALPGGGPFNPGYPVMAAESGWR